jgi:hypothetical protein
MKIMEEPKKEPGRSKIRGRKTLSLPVNLVDRIQVEADMHWGGDWNRAALEALRRDYPVEVAEFLKKAGNPKTGTQKHSRKKF